MSINIKNLTVEFKNGVRAVDDVEVEIGQGIFGLLGENGAGKTTLMRTLTTVIQPQSGQVILDGMIYCEKNYEAIKRKIGYLPQELNLYPDLGLRECLEYLGKLSGLSKEKCRQQIDYYLERTSLASHQKKKIKQLSGGMKRRAGLIQALLHEPDFLIIDEPTAGLDPEERVRIRKLLVEFSARRTVLFSTHVVEDLAATCSQLAVMKKGRFIYQGEVRDLLSQASGRVWNCLVKNEEEAARMESSCQVSGKQYVEEGILLKIISDKKPEGDSKAVDVSLEDAYMCIMEMDKADQ